MHLEFIQDGKLVLQQHDRRRTHLFTQSGATPPARAAVSDMPHLQPRLPRMNLSIGDDFFAGYLRTDVAPLSCEVLRKMLPLHGEVIHARWSGESIWSPLSGSWPVDVTLPAEHETHTPRPGDVLLFGGGISEPELLICYGPTRFGCVAGPLAGNPVITICDRLERLSELGHAVLRRGALQLEIASTCDAGP